MIIRTEWSVIREDFAQNYPARTLYYLFVDLFICLNVYLPTYIPACLFVCLFVCLHLIDNSTRCLMCKSVIIIINDYMTLFYLYPVVWWVRPSVVRCSKCDFGVAQVRSRGFPRTTLCVSSCSRTCGARAMRPCALKYCGASAVLRCTWSGRRAWISCSRTGSLRSRCAVSARTKRRVPRSFFRPAHRVTRVRVLSGCGMSCSAKIAALPRFKQAQ